MELPFDKLAPGTRIAGCVLEELAGCGTYAAVYRARDSQADVTVAVKVLNPLFAGDAVVRERLAREVRIGREIKAAELLRVDRLVEDEGLVCLVTEWVEGETLRRSRHSRLPRGARASLNAVRERIVKLKREPVKRLFAGIARHHVELLGRLQRVRGVSPETSPASNTAARSWSRVRANWPPIWMLSKSTSARRV